MTLWGILRTFAVAFKPLFITVTSNIELIVFWLLFADKTLLSYVILISGNMGEFLS